METITNGRAIILTYAHWHIYLSEISIDTTWESASLAYWINTHSEAGVTLTPLNATKH